MISNHQRQTVFYLLLLGLLPILASSSFLRSGGRKAQQCGAAAPTDRTAFVILEVVSDDDTDDDTKAIFNKKTDAVAVNTTFVSSYKDTAQCSRPAVRSVPSATLVRAVELEDADTVAARTRQADLSPTGDFTWLVEVVLSCNACDDDAKLFSSAQDDEDDSSSNLVQNFFKFANSLTLVNDVEATSLCSCSGPSKKAFLDSFSEELSSKLNNVTVVAATEVPVLSDEVCYGSALTAGSPDGTTRQVPLLTAYSYTGVCAGRNIEVIEPVKAVTESPSASPTSEPTSPPTESPTDEPTDAPTDAPTEPPTESPTESPSEAPVSPTLPPAAENYEVFVYLSNP